MRGAVVVERVSVEPLLALAPSIEELARLTGIDGRQWRRWRAIGIPVLSADAVAVLMGYHPAELWTDWFADHEGVG